MKFISLAKMIGEAILETMEESNKATSGHCYNDIDDFSNSYRLNEQCEVINDLEGDNALERGGQWLRKESNFK
ncbi:MULTISPECIES: hypothetical protein [unclassified Pseudoalteromonas]|uniref:hypothetical protein n=1 Tax=unclassified Pseudoalteromonas TaxID=194690 RepID=UPI001F3692F5|nr:MULTISPECIES: hypothetical protein [unclassified Pseudoalteromonas]MCF2829608.1 hypothetical protein [Pseudoalteromonas sp. OF5H-5]MCF2830864.1 hypothetical protein [Pseudoalteromonas sp. DL2-H6]MCF2927308.1 hypothetical protein [Pseudoalteromonas sp. DL2-H1]